MREFKKQNVKQNMMYSLPVLLVMFLLIIVFGYNTLSLIEKNHETAKKKALELENIEILRDREVKLQSNIDKLKTNEGVEEVIRDKFPVGKVGEKVVVIVDKGDASQELKENKTNEGFWSFLKKW